MRARLALASLVAWTVSACGARDIGDFDAWRSEGGGDTIASTTGSPTGSASGSGGQGGFGAGSGSGGQGGFGAGGSGGQGGAGGGGPVENCTNGVDDDGDGLIDCADPDCVEFTCAPLVPQGWTGPVALWRGVGSATPPQCSASGGYPENESTAMTGLTTTAAICPGCQCGTPQGVACQVATEGFFETNNCSGPGGALTIAGGVCTAFVTTSNPQSTRWNTAPAAGGACIPSATGSPILPPLQWSQKAQTCSDALEGGGCGVGACVPRPDLPYDQGVCIQRSGNWGCTAAYPTKYLYFQGANDTRSCTDCGCDDPTGLTCQGTVKLYTDTACNFQETLLTSVSQCAPLPPDPTPPPPPYQSLRSIRYDGKYAGTGSCASVPSSTTGSATPSGPITFCCQ